MSNDTRQCHNCGRTVSLRRAAISLFPPRVTCPHCGATLLSVGPVKIPPRLFLTVSLILGLAIGIGIGVVVTLVSRDWPYSSRFGLLAAALIATIILAGVPKYLRRGG